MDTTNTSTDNLQDSKLQLNLPSLKLARSMNKFKDFHHLKLEDLEEVRFEKKDSGLNLSTVRTPSIHSTDSHHLGKRLAYFSNQDRGTPRCFSPRIDEESDSTDLIIRLKFKPNKKLKHEEQMGPNMAYIKGLELLNQAIDSSATFEKSMTPMAPMAGQEADLMRYQHSKEPDYKKVKQRLMSSLIQIEKNHQEYSQEVNKFYDSQKNILARLLDSD